MTYDQLETHFGGQRGLMVAFGVKSRQTIHNWKHQGVPEAVQFKAEVMTGGTLKADAPATPAAPVPGEARAA